MRLLALQKYLCFFFIYAVGLVYSLSPSDLSTLTGLLPVLILVIVFVKLDIKSLR